MSKQKIKQKMVRELRTWEHLMACMIGVLSGALVTLMMWPWLPFQMLGGPLIGICLYKSCVEMFQRRPSRSPDAYTLKNALIAGLIGLLAVVIMIVVWILIR